MCGGSAGSASPKGPFPKCGRSKAFSVAPAAARMSHHDAMPRKPHAFRAPGADYALRVVGDRPAQLRDFYHALLRLPWWATIAAIAGAFLVANALFAVVFAAIGGVTHAGPASFRDAFFFSVQTMGTIGYGAMYPESTAANVLVVGESILSPLLHALFTRRGV